MRHPSVPSASSALSASAGHASLRVRQAKPRDFLAIAALDRLAWRNNRGAAFIPDGEHVWRVWCEQALVFVACRDASVVGAILAFPTTHGAFWLHKVMVAEHQRGHGIGSRLFRVLLRRIDRTHAAVRLTVDPVNTVALALYAKWGFSRRTVVRGYYRPEEDRYVLTRPARRATLGRGKS
jgi:[ribosomal protein S18]-alanine N-acetyltransferase